MLSCWAENSASRPKFSDLVYLVTDVLRKSESKMRYDGGPSDSHTVLYGNQSATSESRRVPRSLGVEEKARLCKREAAEDFKRKLAAVKAWDDQVRELLANDTPAADDTPSADDTPPVGAQLAPSSKTDHRNDINNSYSIRLPDSEGVHLNSVIIPSRSGLETCLPTKSAISDFLREDQSAYLIPK